jgi:16S rRNA (uracil1498-N3)-methyltransferase
MGVHTFVVDGLDQAVVGGDVSFTGSEAHHAAQVVRVRAGEMIDLVDGAGRRITGEVTSTQRDRVDVRVRVSVLEPPPQPRLTVVQALAKSDRGERAVESLTEVGVDVIVPWSAAHSVVRWDAERARRGVDRWRSTANAAAKQARRAHHPHVLDIHTSDDVAALVSASTLALVLDEEASTPITAYDVPDSGEVLLIVGPEGGISDQERELFASAGAVPARLGPTVLRTSTAGTVAAGIVLSSTSRWTDARMEP